MENEKKAEIFKALGNVTRLNILNNLDENGCNVNAIVEKLNIPQSTVSQHLAILRHADIVISRKEGYNTCYRVINPLVREILETLNK